LPVTAAPLPKPEEFVIFVDATNALMPKALFDSPLVRLPSDKYPNAELEDEFAQEKRACDPIAVLLLPRSNEPPAPSPNMELLVPVPPPPPKFKLLTVLNPIRLTLVKVGLVVRTTDPLPVDVVTPVPPLATGSAVPEYARVNVPLLVTGLLVTVNIAGADNPTELTVPPAPAGTAHFPSPLQNVVPDAEVPPLRFATGRFPVA
jgi:hypothetical protein